MTEPRNPIAVTIQMAKVVPSKHRPLFESLASDFSYKAPEQIGECFEKLAYVCNNLLVEGQLEHDWQVEMISILTMKSKEELLEEPKARRETKNV